MGGFGFSAYLTYRELFTLHKICEWCVGSACLMTMMMCLAVWRFLRGGSFAATARASGSQPPDSSPEPAVEPEHQTSAQLGAS